MIRLGPADFRSVPWRNGGGISTEIAAAHDAALGEGWAGLVWSVSRTSVPAEARFSDLSGMDRILAVTAGGAFTLRARDDGPDITLPGPLVPAAFDGGRALAGVPEGGPVEVVNVIGRRGRVRIGLAALRAGETARIAAATAVVLAEPGAAALDIDGERIPLEAGHALRAEALDAALAVAAGTVLVARIDPA